LRSRDLAKPAPATAARVADHVPTIDEVVALIDQRERDDAS
jgi:hypothetical protein